MKIIKSVKKYLDKTKEIIKISKERGPRDVKTVIGMTKIIGVNRMSKMIIKRKIIIVTDKEMLELKR